MSKQELKLFTVSANAELTGALAGMGGKQRLKFWGLASSAESFIKKILSEVEESAEYTMNSSADHFGIVQPRNKLTLQEAVQADSKEIEDYLHAYSTANPGKTMTLRQKASHYFAGMDTLGSSFRGKREIASATERLMSRVARKQDCATC